MLKDARNLPLTGANDAARDAYERGLYALRSYRGDPVAPLDEAIAAAPGFAMGYVAKALALMTFFERRFANDARAALDAGAAAIASGTAHEQSAAAAARLLVQGEWHAACRALDRLLAEQPRDILALQVAHVVDFFRGDALNLRNRISRVLPAWSAPVPGYPFVLGMHAFGFEECNQYPEAEAAGMRSLALAPDDSWAVHAVVHVMEMQGRIGEGIDFLEARKADWSTPDNGFAFHNWWHLALFHMDRGDFAAALALHDQALAGALGVALSRVDATALLWRLRLEGADIGARMEPVADAWQADLEAEGGFYAFNDFHAALAFAATGRQEAIRALRSKLEVAAAAGGANADMTRAVGIELSEAAFAFCDGRYAEATNRLASVRDGASRFGGSHAQRDLITLTLVEAASRAGMTWLASHYAAERVVHKPRSAWGHRLMARAMSSALAA